MVWTKTCSRSAVDRPGEGGRRVPSRGRPVHVLLDQSPDRGQDRLSDPGADVGGIPASPRRPGVLRNLCRVSTSSLVAHAAAEAATHSPNQPPLISRWGPLHADGPKPVVVPTPNRGTKPSESTHRQGRIASQAFQSLRRRNPMPECPNVPSPAKGWAPRTSGASEVRELAHSLSCGHLLSTRSEHRGAASCLPHLVVATRKPPHLALLSEDRRFSGQEQVSDLARPVQHRIWVWTSRRRVTLRNMLWIRCRLPSSVWATRPGTRTKSVHSPA